MAREDRTKSRQDLLFEALIKQGCSAENAARIAFQDIEQREIPTCLDKIPAIPRASWL